MTFLLHQMQELVCLLCLVSLDAGAHHCCICSRIHTKASAGETVNKLLQWKGLLNKLSTRCVELSLIRVRHNLLRLSSNDPQENSTSQPLWQNTVPLQDHTGGAGKDRKGLVCSLVKSWADL